MRIRIKVQGGERRPPPREHSLTAGVQVPAAQLVNGVAMELRVVGGQQLLAQDGEVRAALPVVGKHSLISKSIVISVRFLDMYICAKGERVVIDLLANPRGRYDIWEHGPLSPGLHFVCVRRVCLSRGCH